MSKIEKKAATKTAPVKLAKTAKVNKTTPKVETVKTERTSRLVDTRETTFVKSGKIDVDTLSTAFTALTQDAARANDGNLAAARRFRINSVAVSKAFKELREATPKMGSK